MSLYDTVIVFGEGPIKPVLLQEELTNEQQKELRTYKDDPINTPEPEFHCITDHKHLQELDAIQKRSTLSEKEKAQLSENKRLEWQYNGWYALRQWGRQNALAAGYALYKGITKQVILSGGRTILPSTLTSLPKNRVAAWPSEAELMKYIIVQSYGALYEKKYGKPIDQAITLEDKSTNTLENFAYTIHDNPHLLSDTISIGLITAHHHLKRVQVLAELFALSGISSTQYSAQDLLKIMSEEGNREDMDSVRLGWHSGTHRSKGIHAKRFLEEKEQRWAKGLTEPEYLTYWLGYIGKARHPRVVQKAFEKLKAQIWRQAVEEIFEKLELSFAEYESTNFLRLAEEEPQKYETFVTAIEKLTSAPLRTLPPSI